MKEPINIFWFKRDLRLLDNEPLNKAISKKEKLLLIYCFEPSLKKNKHYSTRHWNFVKESINDLNIYLKNIDTHIHTYNKEIIVVLKEIQEKFLIKKIFSHNETGLNVTFERDSDKSLNHLGQRSPRCERFCIKAIVPNVQGGI